MKFVLFLKYNDDNTKSTIITRNNKNEYYIKDNTESSLLYYYPYHDTIEQTFKADEYDVSKKNIIEEYGNKDNAKDNFIFR
jgi:hypothetical protein